MAASQPTFRDRARASVEPIARGLGRLGLSPNALTFIGFVFALIAAGFAAIQLWMPAALLVAIGASFDMLDGALARAQNRISRFGAFFDSTLDRAGEATVYVGIALACVLALPPFAGGAFLATSAMGAAFMVSYTRARAESLGYGSGSGLAYVGFAPREVRVVILVLGLILTDLAGGIQVGLQMPGSRPADSLGVPWLILTLGLITILATITTIQRIVYVYLQAKKEQ